MRVQRPLARRGVSRQCALQLDGSGRPGDPAAAGPGRWAARLVAPPSHGDSATSSPRALPAQRAHAARSALPCLHRSCFSLRCACESCSLVFAEICPPRAVPVRCRPGARWGSVLLRRCSLLCYTYVLFPPDNPLTLNLPRRGESVIRDTRETQDTKEKSDKAVK